MSEFSDTLKQFIAKHINSVEQLEVLLLLKRTAPREWTADQVSQEMTTSRYAAEGRLHDLHARGLFVFREENQVLYFRYDPANPADKAVSELGEVYAQRRTTVITMIFSKPVDGITRFADAFRIRRTDRP